MDSWKGRFKMNDQEKIRVLRAWVKEALRLVENQNLPPRGGAFALCLSQVLKETEGMV
jgi:hypothetical protein